MATDQDKEDKAALDALESEAKEWDKDAEIDRILRAFRLDAYAVLDLQPGVPESDIKMTYRKKSLLIHPDKCKNPRAPDAFDRLKKAQTELMDEKHRERLDEAIADARMLLIREKKLTVDSEELKTDAFARQWRDKAREVLVDGEQRRRRQAKAQMQEEGREQRRQDEEMDERKRKRQHEQDWEATREERISSWRQFHKGKTSAATAAAAGSGSGSGGVGEPDKKKKKKKMKPIG
ncbi:J domain-containing protein spf31 [Beauveria bassiana]|uniref:DnaJ domain-containing protein n=1 Tax=Beauveria bassiana (strain ARSEF 2860) TaxID=655819 RepID=J4UJS9_BEAB2|nr:DnaJ domain-containing protein [Beauveria bassiana ARSEF 2860]EJP64227.1 DnaJ domain-containing protein [Beauveria bassiana ARSEF 2860]KAF1737897.1 J domain-containing protein spf31 [Beauveria bassiana]KAH8718944.1 J domain-containing protein spf31 [Beauveria bassiana]